MKQFVFFILFSLLIAGCKPRLLSGKDLENKLIETMGNYLDTTLKSGVHIEVKDVSYLPEPDEKLYICRFHVNMKFNGKDTTGIVIATITNDFKTVKRTQ